MSLLRVGVVYGGPSAEHEVSVNSGEAMLRNLDKTKYSSLPVFVDKQSQWHIEEQVMSEQQALAYLKENIDFVLLGLHGTFGEDGQVQALLEEAGIAYSGSDSKASKRAMVKHEANEVYVAEGMMVPREQLLTDRNAVNSGQIVEGFGLPLIIKPTAQGSSVGVSLVKDASEVDKALDLAFAEDSQVLVQEYIKGREISGGVLETEKGLVALPPTELIPLKADFFDYDSKYTPGATDEITPPDAPKELIAAIQDIAKKAHVALGCSGYSRTDTICNDKGIFLIETNTLPGMTATSMLPAQATAAHMSFSELLDVIITAGLKRKRV